MTVWGAIARVRVADHGAGVPASEQARLFAPFYRASNSRDIPGTGLGLHISKRLAERQGGRLWLEASSTAGSVFALDLPAVGHSSLSAERPPAHADIRATQEVGMVEPQVIDIKEVAKQNESFRKVLFTATKSQLVVMSLRPGEDIGTEVHQVDQLLYAVKGEGVAITGDTRTPFEKGAILCVPAGTSHNVINTGDEPLKLFTVYSPAQHAAGTVHATKADAEGAEEREGAAMR